MGYIAEISPEVARLAQSRAKKVGLLLNLELARAVAEESVMSLDPELGLVTGTEESVSDIDCFAAATGANDIVINGRHVDVRVLDQDGKVSISRALVGTPYLSHGSLVVSLHSSQSGEIVGYVGTGAWLAAEEDFYKDQNVVLDPEIDQHFNLGSTLTEVCNRNVVNVPVLQRSLPDEKELAKLVQNKEQVIVPRQKQIVSAVMTNASVRELFSQMSSLLTNGVIRRTLSDASLWNVRSQLFVDKLVSKFPALNRAEIADIIAKAGETYGGQPQTPEFRRHVLGSLAKEQLARKMQGVPVAKIAAVMEQVLSGRSAIDSVRDFVKNKVAVDIAATIKKNRQRVESFAAASAEEIGIAFGQLALQPVYATHSAADSGVEAVNEALQLLEAGDLAEQVRALDMELAIR